MSTYKLYYFAANGRATIPRAILSAAKAKWTNVKVKQKKVDYVNLSKCQY